MRLYYNVHNNKGTVNGLLTCRTQPHILWFIDKYTLCVSYVMSHIMPMYYGGYGMNDDTLLCDLRFTVNKHECTLMDIIDTNYERITIDDLREQLALKVGQCVHIGRAQIEVKRTK